MRKQALVFRCKSDLPAYIELPLAKIHAQHFARTAVDWNQPEQRTNHRRFAGAIGPEQTDCAGRYRQREIVECPNAAVQLCNTRKFEQRGRHTQPV